MKDKVMKVLYYVDKKDNTKVNFLVTESPKDLRSHRIMTKIADEIESIGFGSRGECETITWDLVYNGSAEIVCKMGEYDFGIEEVPLLSPYL